MKAARTVTNIYSFTLYNLLRKRRTIGKLHMHFSTIGQRCLPRKDMKTDLVQKQRHILFTSKAKRWTSATLTYQVALLNIIYCSHISVKTKPDSNQLHLNKWERYYVTLFLQAEHCGTGIWQ